ncbi:hypothetical protein [Ollibium composti]|uniref:Uncharacterized protein n=1 Tax=Ollibium composti TaxID=2675109 RepID=A0ABY2QC48_9HYPH|nr:hypothetical protein [Mesorhizobium composti]THF59861.1 hypothetical protein E6C48_02085 [Mesorhizobium composti]
MVIDFVTGRTLNQPEAIITILGFDSPYPEFRFDAIKRGRDLVDGLVAPELAVRMQTEVEASGGKLEILDWDDPIMATTPRDAHRVMIDGIMSLEMALRLRALCKDYNAKLTQH